MNNKPVRVLLVDDDDDDFVFTRDLLADIQGQEYRLDWTDSYEKGVELIERDEHDIYLLDYRLGGKSGLDLLRQVCAGSVNRAPMILLTGQGDHQIDMEAMSAGAADYLVKGRIDASSLERAIRYAVERRRAEDELLKRERLATIGQTMAELAHCMKNLFTAMDGALDIMRKSCQRQSWSDTEFAVDVMSRSSRRLYFLILNMLDFSKVRQRDPEPVDVRHVFEDVAQMLASSAGKGKVQVEIHVEPGAETLHCDRERLFRSLVNLGMNAVDAIRVKGTITFSARTSEAISPSESPTPNYIIEVRDDGSGIPADKISQIFDSFFSTKGSKGTGLGLATTKNFIEQEGGRISVESEVGKGSVFRLEFFEPHSLVAGALN